MAAELRVEYLELGCGNWSPATHVDLPRLLANQSSRREFLALLSDHRLNISALNCSGNQLAPNETGARHRRIVEETIRLAGLLGVPRVVLMSGCPGGPGDRNANWIITDWPPEVHEILQWQWDTVAVPYWTQLVDFAKNNGVNQLCVEPHGGQLVYNAETLLRLRSLAGEAVGANLDPSHFFWMGGDAIEAARRMTGAVFYVHGKDTRITPNSSFNTCLETLPMERMSDRSWNFVSIGDGHDENWWSDFLRTLGEIGFSGCFSLEQEDLSLEPSVGLRRSLDFIRSILLDQEDDAADSPRQ